MVDPRGRGATDIPVKGLRELDAVLSALPRNLQKNAYRAGITAAARVIRDEARQRAPRDSGKMAKAIRSGSSRVNQDGTVSIRVYVDERKEHGFLGYFQEYGVSPHLIVVQDYDRPSYQKRDGTVARRSIKWVNKRVKVGSLKIGRDLVGPVVQHPGHGPQPFLRPALDAKWEEAAEAFAARVRAYLEGKTGFVQELDDGS
jgi:HK97 gp10 family phage protein